MKKAINITLWILVVGGIIFLYGFIQKAHQNQALKEIDVQIKNNQEFKFVDKEDILNQILGKRDTLKKINYFNTTILEDKINSNNEVEKAQIYKTVDGKLKVDITQRTPILRVFTKNESYYIDKNGKLMLPSKKFTARLPIANGYINEPFTKRYMYDFSNLNDSLATISILDDLYKVASYLYQSEFWQAQIEQIYVNKDSDIVLIPKVGNHKIVFGGAKNIEAKFSKLMIFYVKGLNKTGWNEFSTINLKYNNQIVCTKLYQ